MGVIPPGRLRDGQHDADLRAATLDAMAATDREARLERIRALGPGVATRWLPFAKENLVVPIVARALMDAYPDGFPGDEPWKAAYEANGRRMRIMLAELDVIAERLDAEGMRMVGLKNTGIARGIFPDPALCPMGDMDVLVEKARFREAHAIIEACGFTLATRGTVEAADLEEGLHSGGTEYVKEVDGETVWFELQWRPVAGRWIRADQEPDGAELLGRSVPIEGTKVRLLSPVDNMIQVALHTAKHTYVRSPGLRLHTDVDRLSVYTPPDWDRVVDMAERLEIRTAVYFSLAFAQALLGSPVPPRILEDLTPPAWKREAILRWLMKVDLFWPEHAKFRRPEMMVFTALLYDDAAGLAASVFDTEKSKLGLRHLPGNLKRGVRRVRDIVTRYQA